MSAARRAPLKLSEKIVFAALMLFLAIVVVDLLLGLWNRHPSVDAYAGIYLPHPVRLYTLNPGATKRPPVGVFSEYVKEWKKSGATYDIRINRQGYRGADFGPKTKTRWLALGDSSTFGWDVAEDEAWPALLEMLLRARGADVEVLNLGVPGYSTHQGRLLLPEIWDLAPDGLIVAYGRNDEIDTNDTLDANRRGRSDAEWMPGDRIVPGPALSLEDKAKQTQLGQVLQERTHQPRKGETPKVGDAPRRVALSQTKENLRAIVAAARAHGVPVVLVSVGCFFSEYRQAIRQVAEEENVPFLETFDLLFAAVPAIRSADRFAACREPLLERLGKKTIASSAGGWLWFSTDFGHPNACGHQVIAEALAGLVPLMKSE